MGAEAEPSSSAPRPPSPSSFPPSPPPPPPPPTASGPGSTRSGPALPRRRPPRAAAWPRRPPPPPRRRATPPPLPLPLLLLLRRRRRRLLPRPPPLTSSLSATALRRPKRAGWVKRDVKDPESIGDHMYRMGLMALIASDIPGVDRNKCIKMAIVHDIAEAIVGDITPSDGISKVEKSRREREALDHMCRLLGGESQAKEINELWMEYEANLSPEAKVVKDLDKVEMILQALEYENEQGKDLDEFFVSTAGKFQTELGKAWASEIASRRKRQ